MREASSAENSISASRPELLAPVADPADRLGERRLAVDPELVLEVDVAGRDEHVEVRPLGDPDRLDGPLRVAVLAARERRHGDPPRVSWAIRWTASKSPGEAAGKPASMTSTLSRTSWRATSSFSAAVRPAPGRLLAVAQGRVEDADAARRHERPGGPRYRRAHREAARASWPTPGPGRPDDLDRVEERHLGAQPRTDPLDEVVAVGGAQALELRPARRRSRRSSGSANVPSWISVRTCLHGRPDVVVDDPRAG